MRAIPPAFVAVLFALTAAAGSMRANDDYVPGPDSQVHPGVPAGKVFSFPFDRSKIFPGTTRTCWVYLPAQYAPEHPACLFVFQDGVIWNAPVVFDNLIAQHEMPVTIGVFVSSGTIGGSDRGIGYRNRSHEYSGMNDDYVRFLLDELLPAVASRSAPDGRPIRFSASGNDHAIAGSSAGGICAFTAAWHRPDAFTRVFASVTGFGLAGGEAYSILIRKFEPKPLRIFLQDGSHDTGVFAGNWWLAAHAAEDSLQFSGYEVAHAWGNGGHTGKHATAVFPDALRWLWKDWPQPVKIGRTRNHYLSLALREGEGWQPVGVHCQNAVSAAANSQGEVFFIDAGADQICRIGVDGQVRVFLRDARKARALAFGPNGRLYTVSSESGEIRVYAPDGHSSQLASGIPGTAITVAHNGNIYVVSPFGDRNQTKAHLFLIKPDGTIQMANANPTAWPSGSEGATLTGILSDVNRTVAHDGRGSAVSHPSDNNSPIEPAAIVLSPNQDMLFLADHQAPWIYRYMIEPDGRLRSGQRYIELHGESGGDRYNAAGIACDRDGQLYAATRLGIQVGGEASLVSAILTPPQPATDACFGGADFNTLFALCGDRIFQRKLNLRGANGWDAPQEPGRFPPSPVAP
jgi:gluconolactonase